MSRRQFLAALAALPALGAAAPLQAAFRGTILRDTATPPPLHPKPIIEEPIIEEAGTWSEEPPRWEAPRPAINIVIDDIGNRLKLGRRAVNLPVTCSFLPHTAHLGTLSEEARALGREAILHTPMQSIHGKRLGRGGITVDMSSLELTRTMRQNFASVTNAQGVSNHMGSLLTRHPGQMQLIMESLRGHGAEFFLDSLTTSRSVAYKVARENGIPASKRNIFLDHHRDVDQVRSQFRKLVARAKRRGTAVGIGHPYPETMAVLEQELPKLAAQGVDLVTTSRLITLQRERDRSWVPA